MSILDGKKQTSDAGESHMQTNVCAESAAGLVPAKAMAAAPSLCWDGATLARPLARLTDREPSCCAKREHGGAGG